MFKQAHYHSTVSVTPSRCLAIERASFTDKEKEEKADNRRERLAVAAGMRYSIVFAKRLSQMQHLTIRTFWWSIRI